MCRTGQNQKALAHAHGCLWDSCKDVLEVLLKALVSSNLTNEEPVFSSFPRFMAKVIAKFQHFAHVSISGNAQGRRQGTTP